MSKDKKRDFTKYVWYQGRTWRYEGLTDRRGFVPLVNLKDRSKGIVADPKKLRNCTEAEIAAIESLLGRRPREASMSGGQQQDAPDIEAYIDAAKNHGADSDPDHEVGDLQDYLRAMWSLLTEEQRVSFRLMPEVHEMFEENASGPVDTPER